jgi:RecA DNA recombination protein
VNAARARRSNADKGFILNGLGRALISGWERLILTREANKKRMSTAARANLEALLRARKLDITLTTSLARHPNGEGQAATGLPALDEALGGGLRRGHLSEIVAARSTGRTTVMCAIVAAAIARGEIAAIVDTHDRFDPACAAAAGIDLTRLLWIRDRGDAARALKAMNLVLQAGGFGVVVFDLADARGMALRQFPTTTWMRLSRIIEGSQTVALLLAAERLARSPGGVTITLEVAESGDAVRWAGQSDRARLLDGLNLRPRVVSAHVVRRARDARRDTA